MVYTLEAGEKENFDAEKAESLTSELYNIYIPIENISAEEILLRKDQNLDHLELIEDIKETREIRELIINPQGILEAVNAITPTVETIAERKNPVKQK